MTTLDKIIIALGLIAALVLVHLVDVKHFEDEGAQREVAKVAAAGAAGEAAAAKVQGHIDQKLSDAEGVHAQELAEINARVAGIAAGLSNHPGPAAKVSAVPAPPASAGPAPAAVPCDGVLSTLAGEVQRDFDSAVAADKHEADYRLLFDAWYTPAPPPH